MCIEKMIDEMSDACYLEHYCFRHRLHSYSLAARFLRIAANVKKKVGQCLKKTRPPALEKNQATWP